MDLLPLFTKYGYFALLPLAMIEGPILSLAVGFLVHQGFFSFLPAFFVLMLGDFLPDSFYYYLGYKGNQKNFLEKYGSKFKLISGNIATIKKLWYDHSRKTMFFSKLASGLAPALLVSAGLVRMPYRSFIFLALIVTSIQYSVLMIIGYYLGQTYEMASKYIESAGILIAAGINILIIAYIAAQKYAKKQIEQMEIEENLQK